MKKLLALLASVCLLALMLPVGIIPASAETVGGSCGENLSWSLDTVTGALTIEGTGAMEEYYTASSYPWSSYRSSIRSVTVGNGITSIGSGAFEGCNTLIEICNKSGLPFTIGKEDYGCIALYARHIITDEKDSFLTTTADGFTFYEEESVSYLVGYSGNETNLTLPQATPTGKQYEIHQHAFGKHTGLTSVIIPDGITGIGEYAFDDCKNLTSIEIGKNVETIGYSAFNGCWKLKSITIPDSVTDIGAFAFGDCAELESITVGNGVTSIGNHAFDSTAWYFTQPNGLIYIGNVAYQYKGACPETVTLTDGTKGIAGGAFYDCTSLKSITIPDGVTNIGDYAFEFCENLESVPIPDSVTSIGDFAFTGCSKLTYVTIPDDVTGIGYNAFSDTAWYDAQPDGLIYAGKVAYQYKGDCPTEVTIRDGIIMISPNAFSYSASLTSITIPGTVENIGNEAFAGCDNITETRYLDDRARWNNIVIGVGNDILSDTLSCADDAPTVASLGFGSLTLETYPGCEYSCDGGEHWQASPVFRSLTHGQYTFCRRRAATADRTAGATGKALTFYFKYSVAAPDIPIVLEKSSTSITLQAVAGCEYRMDGGEWQTSPVFSGLVEHSTHTFEQRYAETELTFAGPVSAPLTVTVGKQAAPASPADPTLVAVSNGIAVLKTVAGCEYSIDGIHWQDGPAFSGIGDGETVTFYQRYAETETTYASDHSTAIFLCRADSFRRFGDANGDGKLDADDLTTIAKYVAKIKALSGDDNFAADVTRDGMVDSDDMTKIAKYIAKIIPNLD